MSDATRTLSVKWVGDTKSLEDSAGKAEKKVGGFGKALGGIGGIAAGAFGGAALMSAGSAAIDLIGDATQAAIEDEKAQKSLAKTLGNTLGATQDQVKGAEEWISKQGKVLGFTDDELRPAMARMALSVDDVEGAQNQLSLAMDIAAGTGTDLQTVTEGLAKGADGNMKAYKKYGLSLKDNEGNLKTAAQLNEELNQKFGGQAAEAANTTAGKMERMQLQFSEMKEELGAKLLPVLTAVMDFLMNKLPPAIQVAVDAVKMMVQWIQEHWSGIQDAIQPVIDFVVKLFGNLQQMVGGVIEVFQGLVDFFAGVFTGDWSRAWEGIKKMTHGFFDIISGYVQTFIDYIVLIFAYPWKAIQAIWDLAMSAIEALVKWYIGLYVKAITFFVDFLVTIFTGAWDGLKNGLTAAWDWVVTFITGLPDKATALLMKAAEFGQKIGGAIKDGITGVIDTITEAVKRVVVGAMNMALKAYNQFDIGIHIGIPSWVPVFGGKSFDIDDLFPDVPLVSLATGGVTRSDGLAYLHANEVVAPLAAAGIGTTVIYNVNVNVAPTANLADAGRQTVDAIRAYERNNGATWRAS